MDAGEQLGPARSAAAAVVAHPAQRARLPVNARPVIDRPMRSNSVTGWWGASAFAAAATVAAAALVLFGAGERGTDIALKATARLSFLLFWLAYAGGGLAALVGPALQLLKRHGRDFGLAFASAHLIHIALVVWLCWIGAAPDAGVFRFFVPPLVFVYILALFSIRRLQQVLGRTGWWLLRTFAMTYIAYAFAADFRPYPLGGTMHILEYLPFAVLSIAGPILYFAALLPSVLDSRRKRPLA